MILRPYGIVIDGRLEIGLELVMDGSAIAEIRPHTGVPEAFVVSPAFVNAHSHLEYRGLQGSISEREWWPWIRAITRAKMAQDPEQVRKDTYLAARENAAAGVALIGEHSDRPYAGEAMADMGLDGIIYQETITFFESESPAEKLDVVRARAELQRQSFGGPVVLNPHAVYTVDRATLADFGRSDSPISLHLAESPAENQFTEEGKGPIADFYREHAIPFEPTGLSAYWTAKELALVRPGTQIVHGCDLSQDEISDLAATGASAAHCPRSNEALGCPTAPIREMLDAGILVGLGLDSPASSGPIDFFAEMRAAMRASAERGAALTGEEVWRMATAMGAASIGGSGWAIEKGSTVPLIKIHVGDAFTSEELIERASPEAVEWN